MLKVQEQWVVIVLSKLSPAILISLIFLADILFLGITILGWSFMLETYIYIQNYIEYENKFNI